MSIEVSSTTVGAANASSPGPFLGWRMVGVAFVAQFISTGVVLSIVGNFSGPISEEFGVPQTMIGIAPGVSILVMGIAGPFVGRALDGGHARRLMATGALLTGLGLILLSRTHEFWLLGVIHVSLVSTGAALFGAMPSMALVTNWFVRQQGFALGLAVAGATLASFPAPAAAEWMIINYDWRTALFAFGVFTLVAGVPAFATLVIGRPEFVGQRPDGDDLSEVAHAPEDDEASQDAPGTLAVGVLARDSRLWLAAVGFGLVMSSPVVLIALLIPYGKELGFSGKDAAYFFAAMTPFSLLGKLVLGRLADRAPLKPIIAFVVLLNIACWGILSMEPGFTLFLIGGAIYGLGIGGAAPVHGVLLARLFGRANYGRVSGLGGMAAIPLLVLANFASQAMLGATGSYQMTFGMQAGLLVVGGILLASVRIPDSDVSVVSDDAALEA